MSKLRENFSRNVEALLSGGDYHKVCRVEAYIPTDLLRGAAKTLMNNYLTDSHSDVDRLCGIILAEVILVSVNKGE